MNSSDPARKVDMEPHPVLERFMKEFSFRIADDEAQKHRVFRLRHDVYCEELGFEPPTDPVNRLEYDDYDQAAIHCLIEHRRTGLAAACTRLVLPQPGPSPLDRLPLENYGGNSLTHDRLHPRRLPPSCYFEISRLAVARTFRTRIRGTEVPGISDTPHEFSAEERETFGMLVSALFLAGYVLGRLSGKSVAFAMMEPKLPRLLAMSGFKFTKVGETIDFHGKRSAYCITREQAEQGMSAQLVPLYRYMMEDFSRQLELIASARDRTAMNS